MVLEAGVALSLILIGVDMVKTYGYDKRDSEQTKKEVESLKTQTALHYEECDKRHEDSAKLSAQVEDIRVNISQAQKTQQWMGDGIVKIAAKMNVDLPQRP